MYKNIFVACLLLAVVSSAVYLTPAYPSTAYQNQFYSVRFRVRGLDDPVFSFEGLPKSLTGKTDGVISGTPEVSGSFSVLIKYRAGAESGSKQVILKVLEDYRNKQFIVKSTQTKVGLVIEYPDNLIFRAGQSVQLAFTAKNAVGKLIWSFVGLPSGIRGSAYQGSIDGAVLDAGYYNFQVECADADGKSAQAYVTINIQPKVTLTSSKIVDVSRPASKAILATYEKIEAEQIAADSGLFKALDVVDTRKKVVADTKQHTAIATLKVTNAQLSFEAADNAWRSAVNDRDVAQSLFSSAQSALLAAQKNLEIALTEQGLAAKTLAAARKTLEEAQQRFNAAQINLSEAEKNLVDAKAKYSKAEQTLRAAQTQKAAALEEYKRAYDNLEAARTQLEDAKNRKALADQAVKAAQDSLELAVQSRDDADNALKQADFTLDRAEKTLKAAIIKVAAIREKYNVAKDQLEAAQWDWQLAVNKLYLAQSRKETADRASSIALAEGSLSDHNVQNGANSIGGSTSLSGAAAVASATFGGCDSKAYPSISGTSKVVSVNSNGYSLASGHNVVYGQCSSASAKVIVGDFVKYNGYINNGLINALRIERVLLS